MRRRGWVTIPSVSLVSMMKRFVLFLVAGLVLVGCEKDSDSGYPNKPTEKSAVIQQNNDDGFGNADEAGW